MPTLSCEIETVIVVSFRFPTPAPLLSKPLSDFAFGGEYEVERDVADSEMPRDGFDSACGGWMRLPRCACA